MARCPYYFIALTTYRGWGHADRSPSRFLEKYNIKFVTTQIQQRVHQQEILCHIERDHPNLIFHLHYSTKGGGVSGGAATTSVAYLEIFSFDPVAIELVFPKHAVA